MRVVITSQAGAGHIHPVAPVADALRASGHDVTWACPTTGAAAVQALGFRVHPVGSPPGQRMAALGAVLQEIDALESPDDQMRLARRRLFAGDHAADLVSDLLRVVREQSPDVIVRDSVEFGGWAVAERTGVPHASVEVGAFWPAAEWATQAGAELARLREAVGLGPEPALESLYRYLHLAFVPGAYRDPAYAAPATACALRPQLFDRFPGDELPPWVAELPERPTVYATLGTAVFNRRHDLFRAIVDALEPEPINLIVTLGRGQDPGLLGPRSPNVRIEPYIPQSLVLPHCDLVVCHGGQSTVLGALALGLPIVALPLGADQWVHARRCAALGVGGMLGASDRSPQAIRAAVVQILSDASYRQRAQGLRDEIAAMPGPERAVSLIETLAATRRPVRGG